MANGAGTGRASVRARADHFACQLRRGDVNVRIPRLAACRRRAWWRSADAAGDLSSGQSISAPLQTLPVLEENTFSMISHLTG